MDVLLSDTTLLVEFRQLILCDLAVPTILQWTHYETDEQSQ